MPFIFEECHRESDGKDGSRLIVAMREISEAEAVRLVSTNQMKLDRWPVLTKEGEVGYEIGATP